MYTCLFLAVVTILLYAPVVGHSFIDYDDADYVFDNPHVTTGLSTANLVWAFRTGFAANWHPLTWLSHMLDCQLFGLNPGPQHLVNALLHAVNTALLFFALARMTGQLWRSAFVAALFGWHPLHVESVAWIAERKDVLSTTFGFLTIVAYHSYTRHKNWRRYALVALFFSLGLMAKPMLVTLPCVLLLLDYWPLRRFQPSMLNNQLLTVRGLLVEKIPLFSLAAAACVITFLVQRASGAVVSIASVPLPPRLENGLLSCFRYLGKMVWPDGLMLPYMFGLDFNPMIVLVAALALAALTFAAIRLGGRFQYLPVGWLWYLGTLMPVIGVVQVGIQSMADRYTYIPSIGVSILIAWGAGDALAYLGMLRKVIAPLAVAILGACLVLTTLQLRYWKNSETLFFHSILVQPYNLAAMDCLAWTYATDPDPRLRNPVRALNLATACVRDTDRMDPNFLVTLSAAYAESGRFPLAIQTAEEALQLPGVMKVPAFVVKARGWIELYQEGKAIHSTGSEPGKGG
ncbi:MAG TPA: hypothetical protein VN048_15920 [Verrucomicrobiae bacterium]|nr:hypothetical protein [Verrucomicrobiae bacterium]